MISSSGTSQEGAADGRRAGEKLARVLVDYSIEAGEGDQVLVSGEVGAGPLMLALYKRLLQVGATPVTQVALPGIQELFFAHARGIHYEEIPSVTRAIYEGSDAQISIHSPSNTRALANVDPSKQQALQKRNKPLERGVTGKGPLGVYALSDGGACAGGRHGPF